jgi:hypothetical protein
VRAPEVRLGTVSRVEPERHEVLLTDGTVACGPRRVSTAAAGAAALDAADVSVVWAPSAATR